MCMAIPSKIIAIDEHGTATVDSMGVIRTTSLLLMPEPAQLGDYVVIGAGGFAIDKVEPEVAEEALKNLAQVLI